MIRTSEQALPCVKELWLACNNIACEATFTGQIVITAVVIPGHRPVEALKLPVSKPRTRAARAAANDDMPIAANEDHPGAVQPGPDIQSG